ncbi:HD-GYP domain-containing protein [Streptomyces sp. HNM0574]|uniref:HD-GYP domain-containing protein n=1 Tax=Streptomyces sp. HNM0574 TaxID=2714954 RepID=UPI00146B0EB6|nr:HD-GYP domain-containing protein [Streptomyces sp. HNM0574]NLU67234.1 HD-GYP domain-containing protein [Streptomyces sp. HNM0574]
MRTRTARLPRAAVAGIGAAVLAAAVAVAPALREAGEVRWPVLLPLAALYAAAEYALRCPRLSPWLPRDTGPFTPLFPVLLAGVFLLPPAAAALVPVPGALLGRAEPRHAGARRVWHAAQLALAAWAAAAAARATAPHLPQALLPAAVAGLAFCLVLTALDGAVLVLAERRPVRAAWRGRLPYAVVPHLLYAGTGLMAAVLWESRYGPVAALLVLLPGCLGFRVFAHGDRERGAHRAAVRALLRAVDIKDRYTCGHGERVGEASVLIARELGMDASRTEAVRLAGTLHDVGKLGVPTRLLCKDGPLTPEERRVIELHPEYGHEMVRGIGFLDEARAAILHHHERLDGSGYPYGLSGDGIPEFARLVAVADAFDAMTSTRSYRRARPVKTALRELRRCAGTQFDPRMVAALTRALAREEWTPAADVTAHAPLSGGAAR